MNSSIAYFLIMMQSGQNSLAIESFQCGQPADRSNGRFNARLVRYREFFKRRADSSSRDHSVADGFAMFDSLVIRRRFQPMPNSVAKIENPA